MCAFLLSDTSHPLLNTSTPLWVSWTIDKVALSLTPLKVYLCGAHLCGAHLCDVYLCVTV